MTLLAILLSHNGKRNLLATNHRASRIFASAFTSSSTSATSSTATALTSSKSLRFGVGGSTISSSKYSNQQFFSTDAKSNSSPSALSATVEDELDSALDDILASAFEEAGDVPKPSNIKVQSVSNNDDGDAAVAAADATEVRIYLLLHY